MMIFRPQGVLPSTRRRQEMAEGQGGMGTIGGVADPTTAAGGAA
jgi:branched-chain amino acid transport system permease protein